MGKPRVCLTTAGLTVDDVYRVAVEGAQVEIAEEVLQMVREGRAVVERALVGDALTYGLNTGLGHLRNQRVSHETLVAYQERIIRAHAAGVGPPLPEADVRAMILARIVGMARGGSGAHPGAFETLVAMLNGGVHPIVPEVGSVGAADLMHMAAVALVVIGAGQARVRGELLSGKEALARAGITPYDVQPKDGLALISANGASIGMGALAVCEAERIAHLADTVGALSLEAITGNPGPFDAEVAQAKPFPGQIAAAEHLRAALAGSYLYDSDTALSVQDPLSFRVMPQVHGALREQLTSARGTVEIELNAIDDNPLVSVAHDQLISNGNFHPITMALAFDSLRAGLAHTGMLAERRMNKVSTQTFGGEEKGDNTISGLLAYSAAALLGELKHMAAPITLECPPLDQDVEDHATLAVLAVTLTRRALHHLETILVIEALLATDVLTRRPALPPLGRGSGGVFSSVRAVQTAMQSGASQADLVEAVRLALHASQSSTTDGMQQSGTISR